jgi:hypothetical protein
MLLSQGSVVCPEERSASRYWKWFCLVFGVLDPRIIRSLSWVKPPITSIIRSALTQLRAPFVLKKLFLIDIESGETSNGVSPRDL